MAPLAPPLSQALHITLPQAVHFVDGAYVYLPEIEREESISEKKTVYVQSDLQTPL